MLDIGTRPDNFAVAKLFRYMLENKNCGACCGEIEVDLSHHPDGFDSSFCIKAA